MSKNEPELPDKMLVIGGGSIIPKSLTRLIIVAIIAFVLFKYILIPIKVSGPGMEPSIEADSYHFYFAFSYLFSEPKRGDIIAIELAGPSIVYLSRVVALPGEELEIKVGKILINGKAQKDEGFLRFFDYEAVSLQDDEFFIVGDNRNMSKGHYKASRIFGRVKRERIAGKLIF